MTNSKEIDPVTFEVLRHRLWEINDEQGMVAAKMTGSPIVYEAYDFNTAILTPEGNCLFVGVYVISQATALDITVKSIIREYRDDPGIFEGDMFLTNDPWYGGKHMNDVVVVAPVFWDGEIICWTGVIMHEIDVGGPLPGSFVVGAKNVYGEAPLVPPVKIVEEGRLRKDIEGILLRNSRAAPFYALNIRARVAAQNITRQRIHEIVKRYGKDTFMAFQERLIRYVREAVKQKLRELPDGTWYEHGYIDHDGNEDKLYELKLAMTKKGDKLIFDFRGTCPQAQGFINCTRSGLEGGIMNVVLPFLCYDLPWATGALEDIIEIIAEEGTINNAKYPAAVSMASVTACFATTNLVNATMAKMFSCSEKYKEEAQAVWAPAANVYILSGLNQYGREFVGVVLDNEACGAGASSCRDGIDTGGYVCSPSQAISNVERTEGLYPILQVFRRQYQDTCGHGKFRGGVGIGELIIPYRNPKPLTAIVLSSAASQPEGLGIYGGTPSSVQRHIVLRGSDVLEQFRAGKIPIDWHEIEFERMEIMPAKGIFQFDARDAYFVYSTGGGGYGDPIERDPELVARDIKRELCSPEVARAVYGVIVDAKTLSVDTQATTARREEIRRERLAEAGPAVSLLDQEQRKALEKKTTRALNLKGNEARDCKRMFPIGDAMEVVALEETHLIRCARCGYIYSQADLDPKLGAVARELPITAISPLNRYGRVEEIVLRQFYCPKCATMISVNVQRKGDPLLVETELAISE